MNFSAQKGNYLPYLTHHFAILSELYCHLLHFFIRQDDGVQENVCSIHKMNLYFAGIITYLAIPEQWLISQKPGH